MFKVFVPGSVLLDIFENDGLRRIGGASFNFSYHLWNLGCKISFLSRLGNDSAGNYIKSWLSDKNFPDELIQTDFEKNTKVVKVFLDDDGLPQYDISSNVASENIEMPDIEEHTLNDHDVFYFGTTIQHGEQSRKVIRSLIEKYHGIKFCDINLRKNRYTEEIIKYSLNACDVLKINDEELEILADIDDLPDKELSRIIALAEKYHIEMIFLTKGAKGSLAYSDGRFYQSNAKMVKINNTVGAGDAFSSIVVYGILKNWDVKKILFKASDFASRVCKIYGAIPFDELSFSYEL